MMPTKEVRANEQAGSLLVLILKGENITIKPDSRIEISWDHSESLGLVAKRVKSGSTADC